MISNKPISLPREGNPALTAFDLFWNLVLVIFIFMGMRSVPIHGDEFAYLYMSRDWYSFALHPDLASMAFSQEEYDSGDIFRQEIQRHRLINGSLSRYGAGIGWWLSGYTVDDLPTAQFDWGLTWEENIARHSIPANDILNAGRLASTTVMALGVLGMFVIGWVLGGRQPALGLSAVYAFNPLILLHGRRAMGEGLLIGFSVLTMATLMVYLKGTEQPKNGWRNLLWATLLGLFVGLTFSAKHNGAIIGLVLTAALLSAWVTWRGWRHGLINTAWMSAISALVALLISYALSPVYWRDPALLLPRILNERAELTRTHTQVWGGYNTPGERIGGMFSELILTQRSYYDDANWEQRIGVSIHRYEQGPWGGIPPLFPIDVLFGGLGILGIVSLSQRALQPGSLAAERLTAGAILFWLGTAILISGVLIPIQWQRYYAPIWPAWVAVQGVGLTHAIQWIGRWLFPVGSNPVVDAL